MLFLFFHSFLRFGFLCIPLYKFKNHPAGVPVPKDSQCHPQKAGCPYSSPKASLGLKDALIKNRAESKLPVIKGIEHAGGCQKLTSGARIVKAEGDSAASLPGPNVSYQALCLPPQKLQSSLIFFIKKPFLLFLCETLCFFQLITKCVKRKCQFAKEALYFRCQPYRQWGTGDSGLLLVGPGLGLGRFAEPESGLGCFAGLRLCFRSLLRLPCP